MIQGVSFFKIFKALAASNFKDYCSRLELSSHCSHSSYETTQSAMERFYRNKLYSFPGNDKLMDIFLSDFQRKQPLYEKEMFNCAAASKRISRDHTFKICKFVGASRGNDNELAKQFQNLFITLNERREIVGWRLTRTTAFDEIVDLLQGFKNILGDTGLEQVIVDDCCRVRGFYQSVFTETTVMLDLFHGVKRVVATIPKGTEFSSKISKEFGLVFRDKGDFEDERTLYTRTNYS